MPSGGSKVIYHQQRVLGMECQRLERIRGRSEMTGKMRRVHRRSKVLLADCGQSGFEYASLARQKHAEISFAERCSIYRCQKREAYSVRRKRQATETRTYGLRFLARISRRLHLIEP